MLLMKLQKELARNISDYCSFMDEKTFRDHGLWLQDYVGQLDKKLDDFEIKQEMRMCE